MRERLVRNGILLIAIGCVVPIAASAQPTGYYQVNYLANLQAGDSFVNLMNAGGADSTANSLCANVYVFEQNEQMIACCTCNLTPNELRTLSAKNDLLADPFVLVDPTSLVIDLVATKNTTGTCDATGLLNATFSSGLRAWAVGLEPISTTTYGVTKTEFSQETPNSLQIQLLAGLCTYIQANGSGYGICNACRSGASGAVGVASTSKDSTENRK